MPAKWLDADTVEIKTGTTRVVRKVKVADLDGFPELQSGRPGRVSDASEAPKPQKRRRKAKVKAKADA